MVVHLWAASSAADTDFTAKLVDVAPDGYARNLCDGIVRAAIETVRTSPRRCVQGNRRSISLL